MTRVSNGILTIVNFIAILIALCLIGFSVWFHVSTHGNSCQKVLKTPILVVGVAFLVISIAGLVGSCCRVTLLLWIYLFVLFLLILGLVGFTIFVFVVTNTGVGNAISKQGIGEHRLGDYSKWLRNHVVNDEHWHEIKSCLTDGKLCNAIAANKTQDYYQHKLSPILSGCCKPPNYCEFQFQNATYWTKPKSDADGNEPDCKKWSNVQTELCFNCEACKAGVLYDMKQDWKKLLIINSCILAVVIFIYAIGCCALSNNRHGYKRHREDAS